MRSKNSPEVAATSGLIGKPPPRTRRDRPGGSATRTTSPVEGSANVVGENEKNAVVRRGGRRFASAVHSITARAFRRVVDRAQVLAVDGHLP